MTFIKPFIAMVFALSLSAPAMAEDAASVIREFYETVDDKSQTVEALEVFFSDDYKDNNRLASFPAELSDREAILTLFAELERGLPDAVHSLDILENIGENRAMVYWTFTGTHTGPFFGAPATGNQVKINGVDILRVENGKFVEQWHVEELMLMFEQLKPVS